MAGLPEGVPYTKVPNFLFEQYMSDLRGSELKVVLVICRKTFGFHKKVDGIALSQIVSLTGLGKNTIIKAIKELVELKIIEKYEDTFPYRYRIRLKNENKLENQTGSKNEPQEVQKVNPSGVQKVNTQKKGLKENERNTTNSRIELSDEINEVIDQWNRTFNKSFSKSDSQLVQAVKQRLEEFKVKELRRAIFIRKRAKFYTEEKPDLKNKPSSFFFYPETIRNDMNRTPKGIYNYEVLINKVTTQGFDMEHYQKIPELYDENGNELWGKESDIREFTGGIKESSEATVVNSEPQMV